MNARTVLGLTAVLVVAVAHTALELGRGIYRRVIDENVGPLGPRM